MPKDYEVLSQRQTIGKQRDDTYGQVIRVTFKTASGAVLSVDVPLDEYNVDRVRELIEEAVAHAQAIQDL